MQTKKIVITSIFVVLIVVLHFTFRSAPNRNAEAIVSTTGTVEEIFIADAGDLVLKLKNDRHLYYVSGGLENELSLEDLKKTFSERRVEIFYMKGPSLLTVFQKRHQVAKMNIGDIEFFSEGKIESLLSESERESRVKAAF